MTVYALWHGGYSYAVGDLETHLETFASLKDVGYALSDRYHHGDWSRQRFDYADGRTDDVFCPTVTDNSEFLVWFSDPRETADPYPDRRVYFGPRLGVRVERC